MQGPGRPRVPLQRRREFWRFVRAGEVVEEAAAHAGVSENSGRRWFREAGGVIPASVRARSSAGSSSGLCARLSLAERKDRLRTIGRRMGESDRPPAQSACVDHQPRAAPRPRQAGGYRASFAQAEADARAERPKCRSLLGVPGLRGQVQDRLDREYGVRKARDRPSLVPAHGRPGARMPNASSSRCVACGRVSAPTRAMDWYRRALEAGDSSTQSRRKLRKSLGLHSSRPGSKAG